MSQFGIYRSPEGDGGGGGERTYTEAEVNDIKKNSFRGGFNEAKSKAFEPFLERAREKGYESSDFNELFDSVLGHAEVGKKNASYNKEAERKLQAAVAERDAFANKYKGTLIQAEIAKHAAKSTNPQQVAKLLQLEYKFDVDEHGTVRVFNPDGTPVRKDAYTDMAAEEVVTTFLKSNPHFIGAEEKKSLATGGTRNGSPAAGDADTDLEKINAKPAHTWTPEERKLMIQAIADGKVTLGAGGTKIKS
jgi:hypothetical protein